MRLSAQGNKVLITLPLHAMIDDLRKRGDPDSLAAIAGIEMAVNEAALIYTSIPDSISDFQSVRTVPGVEMAIEMTMKDDGFARVEAAFKARGGLKG